MAKETAAVIEAADPWDSARRVNILPTEFGANDKKYFGIGGRGDWYKTGYEIEVPVPIADLIDTHNEAIRSRQRMYNAMREQFRKDSHYLS